MKLAKKEFLFQRAFERLREGDICQGFSVADLNEENMLNYKLEIKNHSFFGSGVDEVAELKRATRSIPDNIGGTFTLNNQKWSLEGVNQKEQTFHLVNKADLGKGICIACSVEFVVVGMYDTALKIADKTKYQNFEDCKNRVADTRKMLADEGL